jgi:hypothetical protein
VFNEPERDRVIDDVVAWLAERAAPPVRSPEVVTR